MMRLAVLFTFLCVCLNAQTFKVSGILQDAEGMPVGYIPLTFEHTTDNSAFYETISEGDGYFSVDVKAGEYSILIQPMGSGLITRTETVNGDLDLGTIVLENAVVLGAIKVVGEKPIYRIELDKRIYDMERDPTTRGSNVSDALNNVPSVQVDAEGTISLRGNESVRVLINGKPSTLSGISDPGKALQNLSADMVQRVEVITNPSARYEAEGSAGIINIVLKKGANQGFNASFGTFVGTPTSYGLNANMNYKTKDWNFFVNPNFSHRRTEGESTVKTQFFNDLGVDTIQTQSGLRERESDDFGINLGVERQLDDKNTLTLSGNFRSGKGDNTNTINYKDFVGDLLYADSRRIEEEEEEEKSYEANFEWKREFDKEGQELVFTSSISYAEEEEPATITELVNLGSQVGSLSNVKNKQQQRRILLKGDYVHPLGENGKFEFGFQSKLEDNVNSFSVAEEIEGVFIQNARYTDKVDYAQDVHAVYSQYGQKIGKFSFLLGLRLENSNIEIRSASANDGNGSTNKKDYTNLFPSATLNYFVDEDAKNQFQVSYSRRIRRPWSRFLSPFFSYADDRNNFSGNPDLDPEFNNTFELAYITQIGKTTFTPSLYYQKSEDEMNFLRRQITFQGQRIFTTMPINAGSDQRYGAEFVLMTKILPWWRTFGNLNLFGYKSTGSFYDEETDYTYSFDGDGFNWSARLSNNISLPYDVEMQLNGYYSGPQNNAQGEREARYGLDFGLAKDILNGNGTLTFNINDVLNSRRRQYANIGEDYRSDIDSQWRGRTFKLNFSYRINQKKTKGQGRSEGGMDEGDMGF